jgi:hypothetical protein
MTMPTYDNPDGKHGPINHLNHFNANIFDGVSFLFSRIVSTGAKVCAVVRDFTEEVISAEEDGPPQELKGLYWRSCKETADPKSIDAERSVDHEGSPTT